MKITIYELLGMVKDGKAPKKTKISELTYTFNDMLQLYFDEDGNELTDNISLLKNLDEPVEILEEEKEIPEKIEILPNNEHYSNEVLYGKINEIIDYLDYLKSKGDE